MILRKLSHNNAFDTYNANSYMASLDEFVNCVAQKLGKSPKLINATPKFVEEHKIPLWLGFPLWLPYNFCHDNSRLLKEYQFTPSTVEATTTKLIDYYANGLKWRDLKTGTGALEDKEEQRLMELLSSV